MLVLSAVVAGVALALVLSSGDDDGDESAATTQTTATATTETATTETATDTTATETTQTEQQDQQQVEQTVTTFVESAEQSDPQACSQLTVGGGQLENCAAAAGINLRQLPSSDELQIDNVDVTGNRATAKLSSGGSFSLKKSGDRWKISGFRPRGGGQGAPGERGPER